MGKCSHCGKFILGGKQQGEFRFCNDACHQLGFLIPLAEHAAPERIVARLEQIRALACPKCQGADPLDIYTAHTVWSLFVVTCWKHSPQLSCAKCGRTFIRRGLAFSMAFGWWGFPVGLVMTPWQIINGFKELANSRDQSQPSAELVNQVKLEIAAEIQGNAAH